MAGLSPRKWALRAMLNLPTPVLRAMSGGKVAYRNGRTLDPRLQFLAETVRRYPALDTLPPAEARRRASAGAAVVAGDLPRGVRAESLAIPTPDGPRPARLYRPPSQDPALPVLVFAHQGGGVIGDLDSDHAFCGILAAQGCRPVLSIDYRLAPEHRFPAGFDDFLAAYHWARDNAGRLDAPKDRAAVGGTCMGGAFAAAACQQLKRAGEPQPDLQLLVCPAIDLAAGLRDSEPFSAAVIGWFLSQYLGADLSPTDPKLSPLRELDVSGLAPAIIATAGFDPLLDQAQVYARRLMDAGTPVTFRCYDGLCHGFTAFTGAVPAAEAACLEIGRLARGVAADG